MRTSSHDPRPAAEILHFEQGAEALRAPKVLVLGVGGGGSNAVAALLGAEPPGTSLAVANTDRQALLASKIASRLPLGERVCQGYGAGSRPEVGRAAALESREIVERELDGADIVFLAAGLGGGTGTGGAPVFAEVARAQGALCIGVVTLPFPFEGQRRRSVALEGLERLRAATDGLIVISNERLSAFAGQQMRTMDAFAAADAVLRDAVRAVVEMISRRGHINLDFADLKTVLAHGGLVAVGSGSARGPGRAADAARKALASPLLADGSMEQPRGLLVQLISGTDLRHNELEEAMVALRDGVSPDADFVYGWVVDESLGDEVRVVVLCAGSEARGVTAEPERSAPSVRPRNIAPPSLPSLVAAASRTVVPRAPQGTATTYGNLDLPPSLRAAVSAVARPQGAEADPFFPEDEQAISRLDVPAFTRRRQG